MTGISCCECGLAVKEKVLLKRMDAVLDDYRNKPGAMIPVLQITQNMFGYLPEAALKKISRELKTPYSEVAGVVGFYSFFTTVPRGEHLIRVCLGTACYVRGGKRVLDAVKKELAIDVGQTTPDRKFSLEVARCFGACGLAPVLTVDDDIHQRVKPAKIRELLDPYRKSSGKTNRKSGGKSASHKGAKK